VSFSLRCFQRLSLPYLATRHCSEVNNACKKIIEQIFKKKNKKIINYIKSNREISVENFSRFIEKKYKENIRIN
jgi:hypothetical protein